MEKQSEFYGELGEVIGLSVSSVSNQDKQEHSSLLIQLDNLIIGTDNEISTLISPSEARRLAKALSEFAEEADNQNFKRLTRSFTIEVL